MPARLRLITAIDKNVKNALRLNAHVTSIKKVSIIIETPIAIAVPYKIESIRLKLFIIIENYFYHLFFMI